MAVTDAQKAAAEQVIQAIKCVSSPRKKRVLADLFLDLVDKETWADYYQVIPQPRSLNGISEKLQADSYTDPLEVHEDLSLVFWNALYYNEPASQIYKDAETLKNAFENEWRARTVLPVPSRTSPPPTSAQKVHGQLANQQQTLVTPVPPVALAPPVNSAAQQPLTLTGTPSAAPAVGSPAPPPQASASNQPSSPPRMSSPDMDVDVGGTPEPESMGVDDMARDGESDLVVQQLERGLPRWEGLGDFGWLKEKEGSEDRQSELVLAIKGHKDAIGNRYAAALEAMPEETNIPYLSFSTPLSLKLIESRARANAYASNKVFDKEVAQLFEKARRWHEPGSDVYGHVLLLQRLYQALTSPTPPSGPPYVSSTNFASLRAGPGTARPLHSSSDSEKLPAVTTFRVSSKDRTFVDEVTYRGWSIKLADWLHLSNPDDPSKPIIAQVFKCYVSDEPSKKGQPGVTACWYYRPEQTFHPAQRQFWENEVFKTSHFADHPVEDIIEKIACQFTARHIRGRPRPPDGASNLPTGCI